MYFIEKFIKFEITQLIFYIKVDIKLKLPGINTMKYFDQI